MVSLVVRTRLKLLLLRTEPSSGLETLKLRTIARRDGDSYVISGQKMYVFSSGPSNRAPVPLTPSDGLLLPK